MQTTKVRHRAGRSATSPLSEIWLPPPSRTRPLYPPPPYHHTPWALFALIWKSARNLITLSIRSRIKLSYTRLWSCTPLSITLHARAPPYWHGQESLASPGILLLSFCSLRLIHFVLHPGSHYSPSVWPCLSSDSI